MCMEDVDLYDDWDDEYDEDEFFEDWGEEED